VLGSGYAPTGLIFGDTQLTVAASSRVLFGGFVIEAGELVVAPFSRDGSSLAATSSLRLGWSGQRWSLLVGAIGQWVQNAVPRWQWMQSARGSPKLGPIGSTLGVFDLLGLLPAHLPLRRLRRRAGHVVYQQLPGRVHLRRESRVPGQRLERLGPGHLAHR